MNKLVLTIAFAATTICVFAQQFHKGREISADLSNIRLGNGSQVSSIVNDTLKPTSLMTGGCGLTTGNVVFYQNDVLAPMDSGYTFGTGILNTGGTTPASEFAELAMRYKVVGNGTLTEVLVLAAKAHGGTTTTVSKAYSVNTNGSPNAVLGTSTPLPMSSYSVSTAGYTKFMYATTVNVTNTTFFVSITVPPFGGTDKDTLAILTTKGGCNSNDSLFWAKYGTTWYSVKGLFHAANNNDGLIFPVISVNTAGVNYINKGSLNLMAASPNPASNSININFSLDQSSKVDVQVIDITGKEVKSITGTTMFPVGKGSIPVDVTDLQSGSYFYSITAGGNRIFSKFMVTK